MSRLFTRIGATLVLAARRVNGHLTARSVWLSITAVAVAVALTTLVVNVSFGPIASTNIDSDATDYWITTGTGGITSNVVQLQAPALGTVHPATESLLTRDGIHGATPVHVKLLPVTNPASDSTEYLVALGVIPHNGVDVVAGLSITALAPGDPHYGNGDYDGPRTDRVLLSSAAADLLDARVGDTVHTRNRTLTVAAVEPSDRGLVPIAALHLSELQAITGARDGDQAEQILVSAEPSAKNTISTLYPDAHVRSRTDLAPDTILDPDLPLAMALTASLAAILLGALFLAITLGLETAADRTNLAVLSAIGFSGTTRALLVTAQTLYITLLGGALGTLTGTAATILLNHATTTLLSIGTVARIHPATPLYTGAAALLMALLTTPYLLVLTRGSTMEELRR